MPATYSAYRYMQYICTVQCTYSPIHVLYTHLLMYCMTVLLNEFMILSYFHTHTIQQCTCNYYVAIIFSKLLGNIAYTL